MSAQEEINGLAKTESGKGITQCEEHLDVLLFKMIISSFSFYKLPTCQQNSRSDLGV